MEIIKQGNINFEPKKFICDYCGCVFIAEKHEYSYISDFSISGIFSNRLTLICKCPCCGEIADKLANH